MKKQYCIIITLILLILGSIFYWFELRPANIRKKCFSNADIVKQAALSVDNNVITSGLELTKRADYDKIFNNEYEKCLVENGIK